MRLHPRRGWFSRWLERHIPLVEGHVGFLDRMDGVGRSGEERDPVQPGAVSGDGRSKGRRRGAQPGVDAHRTPVDRGSGLSWH